MPVFNLQLQFDESGANVAIRRLDDVSDAAGRAARNGASVGEEISKGLKNTARKLIGLIGLYKSLEKAMSFLNRGIELNSSLEQSKIGIASLITSMTNLEDAQGKILEGADKYAAAQGLAANMMKEIQQLGLDSTATMQDLVDGVQSIMGPALQAGMALNDIPKFAVAGAQAMQTLGIPLNQMRTELEALLSGNVNKSQDVLAPKLFADVKGDLNEYLKGLKQAGTLFDEINKRLQPFRDAGKDVAATWEGLVSNMEEAVDSLAGLVSKNLTKDLKEAVSIFSDFLVRKNEMGFTEISQDFKNIAELLTEISDRVGGIILDSVKEIIELGKSFNSFLGDQNSIIFLDQLTNALKVTAAAVLTLSIANKTHLSQVTLTQPFILAINAIRNYRATLVSAGTAITNIGKGILGALGGPWGIALTGAAMAFTELAFCESKAERATRLHTEAQTAYGQVIGKIIDENGKLKRSLNNLEEAQLKQAARKLQTDLINQLNEMRSRVNKIKEEASRTTYDLEEGTDNPINISGPDNKIIEWANQFQTLNNQLGANKISEKEYEQGIKNLTKEMEENERTQNDLYQSLLDTQTGLSKTANEARNVDSAVQGLINSTIEFKQVAASGWNIDLSSVEGVVKSLKSQIKSNLIELGDAKKIKEIYTVLPDIDVQQGKNMMKAYKKAISETKDESKALDAALSTLGEKGKTITDESRKSLGTILPLQQKAADTATQVEEKRNKAHKSAGSGARSAAIAQIDYQGELERTRQKIESLQEQLELDKTEDLTKAKIRIEQKYQQEVSKTKEEIAKSVARKQMPQAKADELLSEKLKATELEKQLALKEAQNKADEKAKQNLETTINFLNELEQMSGQYGLTVDYQNQLIAIQAEELRKTKPELQGYIDEWQRLKELQNDKSFMAGLERGVRKFGADYGDLAAQVESFTTQMGSTIGNTLSDAFMKGKFSAQDFFNSLINMAAQAASNYFIGMIFKGIGGLFSSGTPTSGMSGTSSNYSTGFMGPMIPNGIYNAHGNVFFGGDISAFSGKIVKGPTLFSYSDHIRKFATGSGLMGEAGPEAILPLARDSRGDLGVKLMYDDDWKRNLPSENYFKLVSEMQAQMRKERQEYAGGAPRVNVNITNNSNAQVEAGQIRSDGNGGFNIDVIVSQIEQKVVSRMKQGKSQIAQYQEKAYGMNRAGVIARGKGRN